MLNKGIDITILSKAMGHTNIKQTQRYARLMPKTMADEMSKIVTAAKTKKESKGADSSKSA